MMIHELKWYLFNVAIKQTSSTSGLTISACTDNVSAPYESIPERAVAAAGKVSESNCPNVQ